MSAAPDATGPATLDGVVAVAGGVGPASLDGDGATEVLRTSHDSRAVAPGDLFCCIPGAVADGHDHAAAAVAAGAAALLCERPLGLGVPEVRVASVRRALGPVASLVAGHPSRRAVVLGITGTNGKTTVVHLLGAIFGEAGRRIVTVGTLTGARTTPEAPELQTQMARAVADGVEVVAMEVSSHALDQHRVDGTRFAVAGFTNLSPDHLDHHGTMERYFAAKARLFTPELADHAVVVTDDPHGRLLVDAALVPTTGIGLDAAEGLVLSAAGSRFTWRGQPVSLPLAGRFNVRNALLAAEVAVAAGLAPDVVARGLGRTPPVAGRLEPVDAGQPFAVLVDYAHTPDGLAQVLAALREVGEGRLVVVFGCGGDRDAAKRPLMGAAAAAADKVVLTTDNPRSEDPGAIIEAVLAGIPPDTDLVVEPDRRAALAVAFADAAPGDVVLVAGKGHETTQVIGDQVLAFDDRLVAAELLGGAR
ncbi:UDP-N-acetylmuramoyl-L-alanyl-D-glutamate--2,6-diaminopimelate ligase [Iamia majanohamensis]|uniref:UDP-N-acetylmuramoyl-L-alanyl-D-glutamate--2,6-diaminopimelate ligase n=1 Tax=Iamia majanohamensis TaxID=467976 RepID=A0AAE9Y2W0_9ACTN|nr:UDP-N-acetylmuramoyl-L-alanyl-D-glutamate--2,6-diaminopimelate ligase [Iamia majanohamensis]WCO65225.1 UDP-N-acetylmuramoyl-L-alanyl-D-glutamate--2,6-diaminopimelate ligase [Iamia majanohamensis]